MPDNKERPGGAVNAPGLDHGGHSMASTQPTGYVRVIERKGGAVYYAKLKLPDGTQPQRRLGRI